jgi:hypothetical protein
MRKRVVDLTFEDLAVAGRQAATAAIAESHATGLSTWGTDENGRLIETLPGGEIVIHAGKTAEKIIASSKSEKKSRRREAA